MRRKDIEAYLERWQRYEDEVGEDEAVLLWLLKKMLKLTEGEEEEPEEEKKLPLNSIRFDNGYGIEFIREGELAPLETRWITGDEYREIYRPLRDMWRFVEEDFDGNVLVEEVRR